MLICDHCGEEVEKYENKSKHICKQCYARMMNANSRNLPYIKLIDLSKEEKEKVLAMRKAHKNQNRKKKEKTITKEKEIILSKNPEKEIVLNEVVETFKEHNIDYPLENTSIIPIFKMMKKLLDNYISPYLVGEDLMNKLEADYRHAKEYYSTMYSNSKTKEEREKYLKSKTTWENRHNAILELRRDIKNVLAEYSQGGVLFTELSKDEAFMEKFNVYYDGLMALEESIEEKHYRAELSKLVADDPEFCLGIKTEVNFEGKSKYEVIIKTHYGKSTSIFTRMPMASSEEEAKQIAYDFIKSNPDKFKFTFFDKETVVNKLTLEGVPINNSNKVRSARR